jgi:hypothetical protein
MEEKDIRAHFKRMMATDPVARRRIFELTTEGVNAMLSGDRATRERTISERAKLLLNYIERLKLLN